MEDSQPSSSRCYFFRLPTELRSEIFRYLLVPLPDCHVLRRYNRREGRAPAILRVNRQVYTEAAPILYSETTVVVYPAELLHFCFKLRPYTTYSASDPLYGNSSSNTLHWLSQGAMPLHVFARFQKVQMIIDPNFVHKGAESDIDIFIRIDKDFNTEAEEIKNYAASLQRTNLLKDLAILLSKSPMLKSLELTVFVAIAWTFQREDDEDEEEDDEDIIEPVRLILFPMT